MSDKDSLDEPEGGGGDGDIEIETMDEYECLELEKLIINEWAMPRSSLNRMICKYRRVVCDSHHPNPCCCWLGGLAGWMV